MKTMKTSELIKHLQQVLKKEGDLRVCVWTACYGSYGCEIDHVKAGANGMLEDDDFGTKRSKSDMADERVVVIFGGNY